MRVFFPHLVGAGAEHGKFIVGGKKAPHKMDTAAVGNFINTTIKQDSPIGKCVLHKTQNVSFQTFEDILCPQCCRQLSDIVSYIISLRAVPIGPPEFCLFAFCLLFSIYTCFVLPILMGLSHRKLNKYVKIYRYPSQSTVVHPFADDCFILGLNMIHETNMDC